MSFPSHLASLLSDASVAKPLVTLLERSKRPVTGIWCHGEQAMEVWERLRRVSGTRCTPLILGSPEAVEKLAQSVTWQGSEDFESVTRWIQARREEDPSFYRWNHPREPRQRGLIERFLASIARKRAWKSSLTHHVVRSTPYKKVAVALLPVYPPWEAPLYLDFGGWNDCPPPRAHRLLWRHWHELFGAVPIGVGFDVVEMLCERLPKSWAQASKLAEEHFLYCPDGLYQGLDHPADFVEELTARREWFFWWD